jgi:hypothetical protein
MAQLAPADLYEWTVTAVFSWSVAGHGLALMILFAYFAVSKVLHRTVSDAWIIQSHHPPM